MARYPRLFDMSRAQFEAMEQRIFDRDCDRYDREIERAELQHHTTEPTPLSVYERAS